MESNCKLSAEFVRTGVSSQSGHLINCRTTGFASVGRERVADQTRHPAFAGAAHTYAALYDLNAEDHTGAVRRRNASASRSRRRRSMAHPPQCGQHRSAKSKQMNPRTEGLAQNEQ